MLSTRGGDREKKQGNLVRFSLSAGTVLLVAVALFLLQKYNPEPKGLDYYLMSPLGSGQGSYSLFSLSHLLDLINHQLLVSPVGLLMLLTSVLAFSGRTGRRDRAARFLLILSLCTLAYAFLADPKLGYPRDWDLFAFSALGYTLLGLHLFMKYYRGSQA